MTPDEFLIIAKGMRDYGVSHVKMGDIEIKLWRDGLKGKAIERNVRPSSNVGSNPALAASPPEDPDMIQHKIEQVQSLMKLSDHELIDQLFPEPTEESDAEATAQ